MSVTIRDGKFDVVVAAGPGIEPWPTPGARAISALCAQMGLSVGLLGGDTLFVKGAIPLPGTGSLVFAEDLQGRVHRFQARALVRMSRSAFFPDPFPGWRLPGLIPLETARKLLRESSIAWEPCTVILGTGNRALRFGSSLLEMGVSSVICVETHADWSGKRIAGWEVERRRFEMSGGRITEATPVSLTPVGAQRWEFRIGDSQGVRVIEVGRVVSAGPFRDPLGIREYPPGSQLYELEQSAEATRDEDVEGWNLEEERGRWLATRIVRSLIADLGANREAFEAILRKTRSRIKRFSRHREEPFTPAYQGKWLSAPDQKSVRSFSGVPKTLQQARLVASIECFEDISCNACERACPEKAIDFSKKREQILNESACTACGLCLPACPSSATLMMLERQDLSTSSLVLPWKGKQPWAKGEFVNLVNRRGDALGTARISAILLENTPGIQLLQLDVPTHLVWEARGVRRSKQAQPLAPEDQVVSKSDEEAFGQKVEISLNGERRFVRERIPISLALYEIGQSRPDDALICGDGSCGLCDLSVDGVKKAACRTPTHKGMAIRIPEPADLDPASDVLCPCLGISGKEVLERMRQGKLRSPEAVIGVTHVGEGRCHGQTCMESFRRLLKQEGIDAAQWIDWRFPWQDWVVANPRA